MERIVIEVDDVTAKKWRLSSQKSRNRVSQQVNIILAKEFADSKEDFLQYLDELRSTMKERGLTEEKVNEILNEDDISYEIKAAHFESLLHKASDEAARNGLTEEILQQLLNEE